MVLFALERRNMADFFSLLTWWCLGWGMELASLERDRLGASGCAGEG